MKVTVRYFALFREQTGIESETVDWSGGTAAELFQQDNRCGALVAFEGRVRDHNEGRAVERLEYEIYRPLAEQEGTKIIKEARDRFGINNAMCIHREACWSSAISRLSYAYLPRTGPRLSTPAGILLTR